jgi:hypothetical protein
MKTKIESTIQNADNTLDIICENGSVFKGCYLTGYSKNENAEIVVEPNLQISILPPIEQCIKFENRSTLKDPLYSKIRTTITNEKLTFELLNIADQNDSIDLLIDLIEKIDCENTSLKKKLNNNN